MNPLEAIEHEMRRMLSGQADPYSAGLIIWEIALAQSSCSPETLHPLWLIWGALTDWVENRPQERANAEAELLRASREWLAIDTSDPAAKRAYLDRWVYEELGYERKRQS
jgi:hypothetical protein